MSKFLPFDTTERALMFIVLSVAFFFVTTFLRTVMTTTLVTIYYSISAIFFVLALYYSYLVLNKKDKPEGVWEEEDDYPVIGNIKGDEK